MRDDVSMCRLSVASILIIPVSHAKDRVSPPDVEYLQ